MGSMKMGMMFQTGGDSPEMNDETKQKVADYITRRVGGMRCTDHGEVPTVIVQGTRLDSIRFDVKGCCQKIIHQVRQKLEE